MIQEMKRLVHRTSGPKQKSKTSVSLFDPWIVMRTRADGRCAFHAISQVLRGKNLSFPYDPLVTGLKTFYPSIRNRIEHLYRTGRFILDNYDVSNPQVFQEFIKKTVPWVSHVIVLRESDLMRRHIKKGSLTTAMLTVAALQQGYKRPFVNAIRKRKAAIFIHQPSHWIAVVPSEHNPCGRS